MNQYSKSKTSLFLMELIITILLFSVCSAVCMKLFAASNLLSKQTKELNNAVACAQGYVEVMRGTSGDFNDIVAIYKNAVVIDETTFEVFYDGDFNPCEYNNAKYISDIIVEPNGAIQNIIVKIIRLEDYAEIYNLTATKYMNEVGG